MHVVTCMLFYLVAAITVDGSTIIDSPFPWMTLPPTPKLPQPRTGQYANINHIQIWYNIYGPRRGTPVLFLHGGFANSDYWGLQIRRLKSSYKCIVMDSRGQGRSTSSSSSITYDLMMTDVIGLLNYLGISRVHVVGWSDGAIIGLNLAMNYPNRVISLFAFAANYITSGVKDISSSTGFNTYLERTRIEYEQLNPVKDYQNLYNNLTTMWTTLPNWSQTDFGKIPSNIFVWIVDGDHEEAIYRDQPDTMTLWIPQAGELILPRTSHFAFLQDPETFTVALARFMIKSTSSMTN
ncbi:unnamed protein product [Rotaria sp. Silwood1]|nr:unnamed protein product [Rotaria sp. Silwood1]CAF4725049.1 unnamed protein product [Rotaria sp. Silwood1]CAF4766537.1 unnamed protein product [Rotaria sp. Silwood1]